MILQASPAPVAAPGRPHNSYRNLFFIIFTRIAHTISIALMFLVTIGAVFLFIYGLILCLQLTWRQLAAVLRSFGWFNKAIQALEERKNKQVLKNLPPVVKYRDREGTLSFCAACVVCLEDFKDGESCQVLPLCDHAFHSACIKRWLITNQSCPNCRRPITGQS